MNLLLLGGTADARKMAEYLHHHPECKTNNINLLYSVAGLVRTPNVPCKVVSGGFSQFGGLVNFIEQNTIRAIIDVTHPYAQQMSNRAVESAKTCGIPCWRFHRPAWQTQSGDQWINYENWDEVVPILATKQSVFLSVGQLSQESIDTFSQFQQQRQILRTAVKPTITMPDSMKWIKAIGPFEYKDELALIQRYNIDIIVSKNSGGDSTSAKLHVAREQGIPVLMQQRPDLLAADAIFGDRSQYEAFIVETLKHLT